jgi:hypothetical protein
VPWRGREKSRHGGSATGDEPADDRDRLGSRTNVVVAGFHPRMRTIARERRGSDLGVAAAAETGTNHERSADTTGSDPIERRSDPLNDIYYMRDGG